MNIYAPWHNLLGIIVVCCAICGCNERYESDQARRCKTELANVIWRINSEGWVSDHDMSQALLGVFRLADDTERRNVLMWFEDNLFAVRIDRFKIRQQIKSIEVVKKTTQSVLDGTTSFSEEDKWRIRIKLLAWLKAQIDRIKHTEPETFEVRAMRQNLWTVFMSSWNICSREVAYLLYREWMKGNPLYHGGVLKEHEIWRKVADGDMDYVWRSVFGKCVRDIESTKYSSEFKKLCQKELEEFWGRSLGSDDFWNMPKVQNRGKDTRKGSKDIEVDVDL